MNKRKVLRVLVAAAIAAMLFGAYAIVAQNRSAAVPASQEAPPGFLH